MPVVASAPVSGPNELVAQSATNSPAVAASTTSPLAGNETDSVTGILSDAPSAPLTTIPPAATPIPSAQDPAQDRSTREFTTLSTSSTSPAINDVTVAPSSPTAPSPDPSTQTIISTPQLAPGPATSLTLSSVNQSSGSSLTDSLLIPPPGATSSNSLPTTPPPIGGPSSSETETQAATGAILISAASSPSTTASASPSSGGTSPSIGSTSASSGGTSASSGGTSFLQNRGAIIGIATAGSVLLVIFLIYVLTRVQRARRRRRFDREMDESFQEAMGKAAAGWPRSPSPDYSANAAALERAPSALSTHSAASFGAYAQQPLAVPQQQYNYGGFVAHPEYASSEYWAAAQAGPPAMAAHAGMGAWMGQPQPQPQPQPQYATPAYLQPGTGWAGPGPVREPAQSAAIQVHPEPQAPPGGYLLNYTTPPPAADHGYGSPVSPVSMNPFNSSEERALKVANE